MKKTFLYKNILVTSVLNLGDVISATAVATLLKKYVPQAKITF
jgi:ADP-heptose:LPS heptosyltransferase